MNQKSLDKKKPVEDKLKEKHSTEKTNNSLSDVRNKVVKPNKTKELDWHIKWDYLLNKKKWKNPDEVNKVLTKFVEDLLTQQRTELLEEIDKEVIGKNTDCYWSTHTPEERDAINERLDYQRKKLKSLLNKKDE